MIEANEKTDELVDAFVLYINRSGLDPKFPDEVPIELRKGDADYGMVHWEIRTASPQSVTGGTSSEASTSMAKGVPFYLGSL